MSKKSAGNLPSKSLSESTQIHWSIKLVKEALELKPSSKVSIQFIRSIFVSGVALVFDFGLLIFLKQDLKVYYLLAATISFIVGVIVNYYLSIWWVFADHKLPSRKYEFAIFVIINAIGLALNLAIIAAVVQIFGKNYIVAKAISTVIVFFWNFAGRKKLLY